MKEKWIAPKTVIEEFTPNEYAGEYAAMLI